MSSLLAACTDLADQLTAAGIPASVERAKVHTPGAWVTPQTMTVTTLAGGRTARVWVVLVVGDTGEADSLGKLDALLDKLLALDLDLAEPVDTTWALVLSSSPLPAFRVAVDLDY